MALSLQERQVAHLSLVIVWLWTAAVSIQQIDGQSLALLRQQSVLAPALFPWVIWGGAGVDALLGCLMAWHPRRWVYITATGMTLLMTLVGTWLTPHLWLDPLGPLSKNLPILALLWILSKEPS
jgi:hypothetical protein